MSIPKKSKKERPTVKTKFVCSDLEVDSSLVGQVSLVAWQSDDYIRASLSLQFLYPVLCTCKGLLQIEDDRAICHIMYVIHFYISHHLYLKYNLLYTAKASWGHSYGKYHLYNWKWDRFRLGKLHEELSYVPHLWCRRPRWRPVLLCNTWVPNCGNAPGLQCPRFQTSLLCHLDTLSGWERPLKGKDKMRAESEWDNHYQS